MINKTYASYKAATFSINISNFELAETFYEKEDIPAFVHEYCHYIQDLSTISSIFGFSLWLRDVVSLTQIFSNGKGNTFKIPLDRDKYGETINKFRKYYNIYCGNPDDVFDIDYSNTSLIKRHLTNKEISLDGEIVNLGVNELEIVNRSNKLYFGLIVLQEIHAFYAQKLAEKKLDNIDFNLKSDYLPSYPYKLGDFLFDEYKIEIDLETKYILLELCLDTVQAPTVFLEALEKLKNQKVTYFGKSKINLIDIVEQCRIKCSESNETALENIIPDLEKWSKGPGRIYLSNALGWYLNEIKNVYKIKNKSKTFFSMPFTMSWEKFALFYGTFAPPILMKDENQLRSVSKTSKQLDDIYKVNFDHATTIWAHRVLYDLLSSENSNQIQNKCECPLYNNCQIREVIDSSYICKTAPWEINKGRNSAVCQYGMAVHSFGLWQNNLEIKL